NDAVTPITSFCNRMLIGRSKKPVVRRQFRGLEGCTFQLADERNAILGRFQAHRQGRALDRDLRRQGHGDARQVLERPLLETGQLVRAADREGVEILEAHCWFFLKMGNEPAHGSVRHCAAGFNLGLGLILTPLLLSQLVTPGCQRSRLTLRNRRVGLRRRRRRRARGPAENVDIAYLVPSSRSTGGRFNRVQPAVGLRRSGVASSVRTNAASSTSSSLPAAAS